MTPNTTVRIWWDASIAGYRMTSAYNKELVAALKQFIPASDRSWDPQSKIWTFSERQLTPLQTLFKTINIQSTVTTRQQYEQSQTASRQVASASANAPVTSSKASLDTVLLQFVKLLPYDAAKAAYRRASLELHPDKPENQKPGVSDTYATLNAVWARIETDHYKRTTNG